MDYKIMQIIQAPSNMYVTYKNDDNKTKHKIACMALIQYNNLETEVALMDINDGGIISKVQDKLNVLNILMYIYKPNATPVNNHWEKSFFFNLKPLNTVAWYNYVKFN